MPMEGLERILEVRLERREMGEAERGQGMVEYGLMIGLVAILVIGVFVALGGQMASQRGIIQQSINDEEVGEGKATLSAATYG